MALMSVRSSNSNNLSIDADTFLTVDKIEEVVYAKEKCLQIYCNLLLKVKTSLDILSNGMTARRSKRIPFDRVTVTISRPLSESEKTAPVRVDIASNSAINKFRSKQQNALNDLTSGVSSNNDTSYQSSTFVDSGNIYTQNTAVIVFQKSGNFRNQLDKYENYYYIVPSLSVDPRKPSNVKSSATLTSTAEDGKNMMKSISDEAFITNDRSDTLSLVGTNHAGLACVDTAEAANDIYSLQDAGKITALTKSPSVVRQRVSSYLSNTVQDPPKLNTTKYVVQHQKTLVDTAPVFVNASFIIPKSKIESNLTFLVEVSNSVGDTDKIQTTISLKSSIENYLAIKNRPRLDVSYVDQTKTLLNATVLPPKPQDADFGKVSYYCLYIKEVDETGSCTTDYRLIARLLKPQSDSYQDVIDTTSANKSISLKNKLAILRLVAVDILGNESNLFSDRVVGPGYPHVGKLVVIPTYSNSQTANSKSQTPGFTSKIRVIGAPESGTLVLKRRFVSHNSFDLPFTEIKRYKISKTDLQNQSGILTFDDSVSVGDSAEYVSYVVDDRNVVVASSPVVSIDQPFELEENDLKDVKIDKSSINIENLSDGTRNLSFKVITSIKQSEKSQVWSTIPETENLQKFKQDFTDKVSASFTDPNKPSLSGNYGITYLHRIVRINKRTGERITFPYFTEKFEDNDATRKLIGAKAPVVGDSYIYQIFTYTKDPVTLIPSIIEKGKKTLGSQTGRTFFYSPYKWSQPRVKYTGALYPTDASGSPVIVTQEDAYNPKGSFDSYQLDSNTIDSSITVVNTSRVDAKTVKLYWNLVNVPSDNNKLIDSYIVMKTVNGIRSVLATTCKRYYHHNLSEADVGSVHYTVIPVLNNMSMMEPVYSNSIFVDTEVLTEKTQLEKVNLESDVVVNDKNMIAESIRASNDMMRKL